MTEELGVSCPYCGNAANFSPSSGHVYSMDYGPIWECKPCSAWVGCHPNKRPLGRLANAKLRAAKQKAHAAFDPLWQRKMKKCQLKKGHARSKGYKWLASVLDIDPSDCHIGMFDEIMCMRVIEVCSPYNRRTRA